MRIGCTAREALDPQVVLAFIDHHTDYRLAGHPRRTRRTINGYYLGQGDIARTIRRLRSGQFRTVSVPAVTRLLDGFNLTLDDLDRWARSKGRDMRVR